jgi:hypothetical protein
MVAEFQLGVVARVRKKLVVVINSAASAYGFLLKKKLVDVL